MKIIDKLNKWANKHSSIGLDIFRISSGIFLVYKGLFLWENTRYTIDSLNPFGGAEYGDLVIHSIAITHLIGGLMIIFGLLTRIAALAQIPILVGAIIINFSGLMVMGNLVQASIILAGMVALIILGSGKHSIDYNQQLHI